MSKPANVRPERPADHDAIRTLITAAFGRANEAQLVRLLRDDPAAYIPELTLVAERDGEIVGHVMVSRATIAGDKVWPVLALGPIGVKPELQRSGIGNAMMEESLRLADKRGEPLIVLLGHPTYYPRFGFAPAHKLGIEPPVADYSDEAFMVKVLSAYDEHMRGKFAFAPAFDEV